MKGRKVVALLLVAVLLAAGHLTAVNCELSATFYADSCADVDTIVRNEVDNAMNQSAIVGPSVLRLFAHDCFISGCDGSILLQDSNTTSNVERDSPENQSLQQLAFDTINQIKQAVEAQCPGVVSCADILSMASQDVVNNMGGPSWVVLLGRRDGLNSTAASVPGHLPLANMSLAQISGIFDAMGLTNQDLVTLSGAHTVGFAHCDEFTDRLYNFNNVSNNGTDPSLSPSYAATLKGKCPDGSFSSTTVQALDTVTPAQFDNDYYQQLQIGQGLLSSDQVLFVDNSTTNLVTTYANNQARFFTNFVASMTAMSQVGVLTGTQGEIRQNCSAVNSGPTSLPPPSNSSTAPPVVPPPTPVLPPPSNSSTPPVLPPPAPVLPPPSNSSNSSTPPVVSPPAPVLPPPSNSSTPPVVSPPAPVLPPPSNSSAAPPPPANVSTPVLPPPTPVLPPPLNSSTPPPANVSTPIVPPPAPVVVPPPSNSSTPSPNVTTPVVPSSPPPAAASPPPPVPVKLPPPPPVVPSSPPPAAASPPPPVPVKLPPPPPVPAPPPPPIPEKPSPFPPTRPRVPPPAPKPSVPGPPGGR